METHRALEWSGRYNEAFLANNKCSFNLIGKKIPMNDVKLSKKVFQNGNGTSDNLGYKVSSEPLEPSYLLLLV